MEEYHQKTIDLPRPTTGQAIIDAMKAMEQKGLDNLAFISKVNRGEPRTLKVGFSSKFPYKHVAILTGESLDKTELQPEAAYERVAVGTNFWGGVVYPVGFDQKTVEDAVNVIAADLEARLR